MATNDNNFGTSVSGSRHCHIVDVMTLFTSWHSDIKNSLHVFRLGTAIYGTIVFGRRLIKRKQIADIHKTNFVEDCNSTPHLLSSDIMSREQHSVRIKIQTC